MTDTQIASAIATLMIPAYILFAVLFIGVIGGLSWKKQKEEYEKEQ